MTLLILLLLLLSFLLLLLFHLLEVNGSFWFSPMSLQCLLVFNSSANLIWCFYESAKSRAWHACVLTCLACFRADVLTCLHAYVLRTWRAYVFGVLAYLVCLRACVLVMMKCFIFLRVCILGVLFCLICFTFQYLNLKILTAKNLCALLSWTYFLFTFWYQLIKLFETNLREAGKSIDISYSCSCSKAISIFYNLYIRLLH